MKEFLGILFSSLLWIIILVLCFLTANGVCQRYRNSSDDTGFFGIGSAVVASGSMEPSVSVSDFVMYQKQAPSAYVPGDIVVYRHRMGDNEEISVIHRIFSREGDVIRTKGDANAAPDFWEISPEEISGRMVLRIPYVGIAVNFMKTPIGLVVIGIVILLLILLGILISRRRKKKRTVNTVMGEQIIQY